MTRPYIIERIRSVMRKFNPHCTTILYGREARGDANEHSDIDLLILVDREILSVADEKRIIAPLYDIEVKTGVSISPLVMLKKVWESRPFKTPFSINVERDGIPLL